VNAARAVARFATTVGLLALAFILWSDRAAGWTP